MIDFASFVPPKSPNNYLVCPVDLCAAKADRVAPTFSSNAAALREAWLKVLSRESRITMVENDEQHLASEFVQRSALFKFPDRISVRFFPLPHGRSTLAIYSRSVFGFADLGGNRSRIERWLAALSQQVEQDAHL